MAVARCINLSLAFALINAGADEQPNRTNRFAVVGNESRQEEAKILSWNVHNFYPFGVEVRYGEYDDSSHSGKGSVDSILSLIKREAPDAFGLQEVAFRQERRKTTAYVVDSAFHKQLEDMGYSWFRCAALSKGGEVILWNYVVVHSHLEPSSAWDVVISENGQERRCVVGVAVAKWGTTVASVHVAFNGEALAQVPKLLSALDERGSKRTEGVIVFGDFNHDFAWTSPLMSARGFKSIQRSNDPLTGLNQRKLIDQMWFKDVSSLTPVQNHRVEDSKSFSDHYAIVQSFTQTGSTTEWLKRHVRTVTIIV